jgi:hypothetical protein
MKKIVLVSIVFPLKLNGNMPAGLVLARGIRLVTMNPNWMSIVIAGIWRLVLILWARRKTIPGDYMICMEICGNGCRTCIMIVTQMLLQTVVPERMLMFLPRS